VGGFIAGIFTFPTVFFSGLLVLVLLYWLVAGFGLGDFESSEGDIALDTDLDVGESSISVSGLLSKFKLDGIPLTISLSFIILASWVLSFLAVYFIYPMLPSGWVQIAIGAWILLLAPVVSAIIVSPLLQPFKSIFGKTTKLGSGNRFLPSYSRKIIFSSASLQTEMLYDLPQITALNIKQQI